MNQNYKFKSLDISKNGEENYQTQKDPNALTVFETGETRTIDFILKDGTRQNFAYAHYLMAWIGKEGDTEKSVIKNERFIKIFFATHLITLKGYCLDNLYNEIINLSVKSIKARNERYIDVVEEHKTFVTDIKITLEEGE